MWSELRTVPLNDGQLPHSPTPWGKKEEILPCEESLDNYQLPTRWSANCLPWHWRPFMICPKLYFSSALPLIPNVWFTQHALYFLASLLKLHCSQPLYYSDFLFPFPILAYLSTIHALRSSSFLKHSLSFPGKGTSSSSPFSSLTYFSSCISLHFPSCKSSCHFPPCKSFCHIPPCDSN